MKSVILESGQMLSLGFLISSQRKTTFKLKGNNVMEQRI